MILAEVGGAHDEGHAPAHAIGRRLQAKSYARSAVLYNAAAANGESAVGGETSDSTA